MKRAALIGTLMVSGCATEGELMDGGEDGRYAPKLMTTMTINDWSEPLMGDAKYVVNHPVDGDYLLVSVNNADYTKSIVIKTLDVRLDDPPYPIPNDANKLILDGVDVVGTGHIYLSSGESKFSVSVGTDSISGNFNLTADSILFRCYEDDGGIDIHLDSVSCQKAHDEFLAMFTPGDSA